MNVFNNISILPPITINTLFFLRTLMNFIQGYLLITYGIFVLYLIGKTTLFYKKTKVNPIAFFKHGNTVESFSWGMLTLILTLYGVVAILTAQGNVVGLIFPSLHHNAVYTTGIILTLIGFAIVLLAHHHMGTSWRMGIDSEKEIHLVTRGLFSVSRNPVYLGVLTMTSGMIFLLQTFVSMVLFFVLLQAIYIIISTEERFLADKFGEEYKRYMKAVRRFL